MKFFRLAALAAALVFSGTGLLSAADCNTCSPCNTCSSPCNPCNPCGWKSCCDWNPCCSCFYVGGGPIYATGGKFHGWGGTIHAGYFFCGNHAVELELNYLHETANRGASATVTAVNPSNPSGNAEPALLSATRKATLEQWPLMVNYRYHGTLADFSCCDYDCLKCTLFYLGGGIGINFARTKSDYSSTLVFNSDGTTTASSDNNHKNHTAFAGQIFGGLGYAITECWSIYAGARAFFTEEFDFGNSSQATHLESETVSLIVDMGVNWRF